jgi:phosphate transport system substrate-binding protein
MANKPLRFFTLIKSTAWQTCMQVAALVTCLVLSSCSDQSAKPTANNGSASQQKVSIKGSNTVGEELAPRLIAEYKKDHPNLAVELETKGSGSGFWGLIAGVCDIAAASRPPIKDEQQQAQVRGIEFNDYPIGSYSVAVVVNANCPVKDLTKEQVRDIFTGTVQNWKDVGGPDAPIHLYIRDPISGTYLGFRELAMEDKAYSTNATEFPTYEKIVDGVAGDPNGIGYASFQLAAKPGVKSLSIGGVTPSAASVKDGKYPFGRALHLYTNKGKEAAAARELIDFFQSTKGQQLLEQLGFVPKS